jgi:hypothetical protein
MEPAQHESQHATASTGHHLVSPEWAAYLVNLCVHPLMQCLPGIPPMQAPETIFPIIPDYLGRTLLDGRVIFRGCRLVKFVFDSVRVGVFFVMCVNMIRGQAAGSLRVQPRFFLGRPPDCF